MQVNFKVVRSGVLMEWVIIVRDGLWSREQLLPSGGILPWIGSPKSWPVDYLVRESDLAHERDLVRDMGINGNRGDEAGGADGSAAGYCRQPGSATRPRARE